MSTLVVSYNDLEDAAKDAKKAAGLLEEYADVIDEKVCRKLKEYSGSWTSNIDEADKLIKEKIKELRQKQEDFITLASNIETFKYNCQTADNNVKSAIASLSGDFKNTYGIKENIVTKWFNYIGTEIGNSSAMGRFLKDITSSIDINTKHVAEVIKDWYKYDDRKYVVNILQLCAKHYIEYQLSTVRQVLLGSFTDDVTLEGTKIQIALGITGFDLPCDIRDIIGDIYNLNKSKSNKSESNKYILPLVLDLVSIIPIVGVIKYSDEVGTVLKNGLKKFDAAATFIKKGLKNGDEIVDNVGKGIKGGLKTVDTGDLKVIETKSPEVANKEWLARGYDKPPYNPEFEVNVVKAGNVEYVRVFSYKSDGTSNKLGGWLMKKSDIEGLTTAQIADKYALPEKPTHICDVNVNPDFDLQTGIANSVEGWGNGGGQQFDTMVKFIDEDAFVNERLIGE